MYLSRLPPTAWQRCSTPEPPIPPSGTWYKVPLPLVFSLLSSLALSTILRGYPPSRSRILHIPHPPAAGHYTPVIPHYTLKPHTNTSKCQPLVKLAPVPVEVSQSCAMHPRLHALLPCPLSTRPQCVSSLVLSEAGSGICAWTVLRERAGSPGWQCNLLAKQLFAHTSDE